MKYTNQAPKEFDKMSAGFKKKYPGGIEHLPGGWKVQPKYDGVLAIIKLGEGKAYTRQGKEMFSIPHVIKQLQEAFPHSDNLVVFGEVWVPYTLHKDINGASRRQTPQPILGLVALDYVTLEEYEAGESDTRYGARLAVMGHYINQYNRKHYGTQDQRISMVQTFSQLYVCDEDMGLGCNNIQDFATKLVRGDLVGFEGAYDGAMLVDMDAGWTAGAVKEGQAIKVKDKLTLDLKVIGQHAEERDTKLGGYLTVEYKGVPSDVGSGLTQEMLQSILNVVQGNGLAVVSGFTGYIAEVECLGLTPDGKLREPRLKGIRHDTVREEDKE